MGFGINFGLGIQRLVDAQQKYMRAGAPVYLRVRNTLPDQSNDAEGLGFPVAASGAMVGGTTDILISPPPAVNVLSIGAIGMSGGQLRLGARNFLISGTFVREIAQRFSFPDLMEVWRSGLVVGLVTENVLYAIVGVPSSDDVAALSVTWMVTGNGPENLFAGA